MSSGSHTADPPRGKPRVGDVHVAVVDAGRAADGQRRREGPRLHTSFSSTTTEHDDQGE